MPRTKKQTNTNQTKFGVLTKEEIINLGIIELDKGQKVDADCFSNASYDFRIGDEYYPPNESNKDVKKTIAHLECPYKSEDYKIKVHKCSDDNNVLRIKPFTSIVFSTYEKVKMPINVVGRFDLMVKWALQGLILQVGTQIEPGYEGRLFGLLHNFSKKEICIPTSSRLLTAEFSYTSLDAPPIKKNGKEEESINHLEQFLSSYPVIDGTLENFLLKMKEIQEHMENTKSKVDEGYSKLLVENKHKLTIFSAIAIGIFTVAFAIGVPLILTKYVVDKDDYPFKKVYEMETQTQEMYNKMDSIISLQDKTIEILLQNNSDANDTIKFLRKKITGIENELKSTADKSKQLKNGN